MRGRHDGGVAGHILGGHDEVRTRLEVHRSCGEGSESNLRPLQVDEDPDCLGNLIAHPEHQDELKKLRSTLARWMVKSGDPLIEPFRKREDASFVEAYVQRLENESAARRSKKPKGEKSEKKPKNKEKKRSDKPKKNQVL